MTDESPLYLGFDLSTQQLKGIAITSDLKVAHEAVFDFDADAIGYGTKKGVLTNEVEREVYAPVMMWLRGVDVILQRLQDKGIDFGRIRGISGAGLVDFGVSLFLLMQDLDHKNSWGSIVASKTYFSILSLALEEAMLTSNCAQPAAW